MESDKLKNLTRLASLYVDGDLEPAELPELEWLLASDPQSQSTFVELLTTHSDLKLLSSFGTAEQNTVLSEQPAIRSSGQKPDSAVSHRHRASLSRYVAAAIAVSACALLAILIPKFLSPTIPNVATSDVAEDRSDIVARIIQKIDCDWEGDHWNVLPSSEIRAGQTLMMRRGLMELEFTSGARVTLEGPASFTAESPMNAYLSHGKLTTHVPESAKGFTVNSPGAQTVDLGTEFGLFVGEDGITETHVFEGEVIVKPSFAKDQKEILLSDDMAIRTGGTERVVSPLSAVPARFAYCNFEEKKPIAAPVVDRKLALWFSAKHLVQVDEQNGVRSWGDIVTKSNTNAEPAWQVDEAKRPTLVESAIGDQPAIRFTKKTLMVTEPVELEGEQSIVAVFRIDPTAMQEHGIPARNGRQLINLNGPPHLSLRINDKFQLASQNYAGVVTTKKGKNQYRTVGRLKYEKALDEKAIVAVSVYSPSANSSMLYINGTRVDQAKAPDMKSTKSSRYLGSHMFLHKSNFLGDIAEVMVYDTALTDSEVSDLSKSLMTDYGIKAAEAVKESKIVGESKSMGKTGKEEK